MAKPKEQFNIHEYQGQFIESPSDTDYCSLCRKILKEPMLTECCGTHLCKTCAQPNIRYEKLQECHKCDRQTVSCILDKPKWRNVLELKVKCPFQEQGCEWTREIGESYDHLIVECEHMSFECNHGCGKKLVRQKIADHLEKHCPKRQVTCEHCNERGEAEAIRGDHLLKCPDCLIVCPSGCGTQFKQAQYDEHRETCGEVIVPCEFKYAGCDICLQRKLLPEHLREDTRKHIHLQSKFVQDKLEVSEQDFISQIEVSERIYDLYLQSAQAKTEEILEASSEQMKKITAESKKQLEQLSKNVDYKLVDLDNNLQVLYEQNQQKVTKLLEKVPDTLWQLDLGALHFESKIASGQFNEVWKGLQYELRQVAIKKHKLGSMTSSNFLQEALVMRDLEDDNILTLFGVCTKEEPMLIVTEYMTHGNLLHFLRNEGKEMSLSQQVSIIRQAASGMAYLESIKCVHRAVNSRSVLIGDSLQCKLGSFSLAKILEEDEQEYKIPQGERVPIKWSAPEVLIRNKCSSKSDVWSFGVVQYEVLTLRGLKMTVAMAETFIRTGSKIEQPPGCPQPLYDLVVQCLRKDPDTRPSFSSYVAELQSLRC